jgi:hypothetical protein
MEVPQLGAYGKVRLTTKFHGPFTKPWATLTPTQIAVRLADLNFDKMTAEWSQNYYNYRVRHSSLASVNQAHLLPNTSRAHSCIQWVRGNIIPGKFRTYSLPAAYPYFCPESD